MLKYKYQGKEEILEEKVSITKLTQYKVKCPICHKVHWMKHENLTCTCGAYFTITLGEKDGK